MKKRIVMVVIIVSVLTVLCSCGKFSESGVFDTTTEAYTYKAPTITEPHTALPQETEVYYYTEVPTTQTTSTITDDTQPQTAAPVQQTTAQAPVQTTEKVYEKTGEMAFSDSGDNKYIKAVAQKYSVNSENLVALYTVPDNDGNIVLEFDGSTDGNGKLIRTKDTLISIYSVDQSLNSKRASENLSLNEYSYGEMKVMFISTTKYIMPEFEAELKG